MRAEFGGATTFDDVPDDVDDLPVDAVLARDGLFAEIAILLPCGTGIIISCPGCIVVVKPSFDENISRTVTEYLLAINPTDSPRETLCTNNSFRAESGLFS
jgi:hypothetical protein